MCAAIIVDVAEAVRKKEVALELGALPTRMRQAIKRSGLSLTKFAKEIGHDKGELSKLTRAEPDDPKIGAINVNALIRASLVARVRAGWLIAGEPPATLDGSVLPDLDDDADGADERATRRSGRVRGEVPGIEVTRTSSDAERDEKS